MRRILGILGQIMAYAVRHKYVDYNPVSEAEKPRESGAETKGIRVLTPQEIQAFLNAVDDQKYKTLFLLAVMSGARQGELLGLKWSDVDWQNKQVHIQRTFSRSRFFDTKTKYSKRKIDLGPMVIMELKKWKLACPISNLDLMFPNDNGKPM
jgi:integrase